MKKILVLAYAISPTRGSEYSVAWDYVQQMSMDHELVVLYGMSGDHMGDVQEMQEYEAKHAQANVRFVSVLPNRKARLLNSMNRLNVFVYTFYYAYTEWHRLVYKKALELVAKESFDLIHYLGPIGYREPGYLWKIDKPYMWGPIGGANNLPGVLLPALPLNDKLKLGFRSFVNRIQFRTKFRLKKALARTDLFLTATTENRDLFKKVHRKESLYLPENCIQEIRGCKKEKFADPVLQLIFVGSIDGRKALGTLLQALTLIKDKKSFILNVVGDGPMADQLKRFVQKNGLEKVVKWHGKIPRKEVLEIFDYSHLHCITSVSEANTTVIWEAMSCGVPTLSLDHCGMHDVICKQCGFKIPLHSYDQIVHGIADTIQLCIGNPSILKEKADGVLKCALSHTWEGRRRFLNSCYEQAIHNYLIRKGV